jgi:hypothetical protein
MGDPGSPTAGRCDSGYEFQSTFAASWRVSKPAAGYERDGFLLKRVAGVKRGFESRRSRFDIFAASSRGCRSCRCRAVVRAARLSGGAVHRTPRIENATTSP